MAFRREFPVEGCGALRPPPAAALVVAMLLAGCQSRPTAYDAASLTAPPADTKPPPAVVAIREPPRTSRPAPPHPAQRPAQAEAPVPDLVGLNEQQLTGLLGTPTSQTGIGPGKHWYYRMHKCTLDLSLFPNVDTHIFRLLSYEVKDDDRHGDGLRCRSELANRLRERQAQQARND